MKKTFLLLVILCFSAFGAFAQQPVQSAGENPVPEQDRQLLPEAGDIGLGFDAVPFLEYLGNIFNGTTNNSIGADFPGFNQQIFAKYFLTENMAVRARVRLEQDITTSRNRVILDNQPVPDPNVEVTDEWTFYSTFVRVGGGVEFRRGTGRIIGVFGGEASFLYGNDLTKYDYGNPITVGNQAPTSTFGSLNDGRFERIVENKSNKRIGAGLTGFIGVEYYIAPKMSLGAEFTLGVDFIKNYRNQQKFEFWDIVSGSTQTRTAITEGGTNLSLATGNYGGSINLMFYF